MLRNGSEGEWMMLEDGRASKERERERERELKSREWGFIVGEKRE